MTASKRNKWACAHASWYLSSSLFCNACRVSKFCRGLFYLALSLQDRPDTI